MGPRREASSAVQPLDLARLTLMRRLEKPGVMCGPSGALVQRRICTRSHASELAQEDIHSDGVPTGQRVEGIQAATYLGQPTLTGSSSPPPPVAGLVPSDAGRARLQEVVLAPTSTGGSTTLCGGQPRRTLDRGPTDQSPHRETPLATIDPGGRAR